MKTTIRLKIASFAALLFAGSGLVSFAEAASGEKPRDITYVTAPPAPASQTPEEAMAKTDGCMTCHTASDSKTMHESPGVVLGCTDCHGGNADVVKPEGLAYADDAYRNAMDKAHVPPRFPETWHYPSSANPERAYTPFNQEAPEYIRFVNPSDHRIARDGLRRLPPARHPGRRAQPWRQVRCSGAAPPTITASCRSSATFSARPIPVTASRRR
ncbi:MAG: hypothetical protein R3C97_06940 [Geminicoccaceae bacterium]